MVNFVKNEEVIQIVPPPIQGKVLGFGFDQDTGNVTVLVGYTAADGSTHQRYFQQSEIESTPSAELSQQPIETVKDA